MATVVRKLLALLTPRARTQLAILMMLIMGTALLEAMGVASIMPFVALVISPDKIHSNDWLSEAYQRLEFTSDRSFLTFVGVVVLVLLVLTNTAKAVSSWVTMRYQYRELSELRRRLLSTYMARPYAFFLGRNSSELTTIAVGEASGVIDSVLRPSIDVVSGSMVCTFILAVLVVVDPVAALLIGAVLGGTYVTLFLLVRHRLGRLGGLQISSTSQMFRSIWEAINGIKDLKLLGREATFLDRFTQQARILSRTFASSNLTAQLPRYALEVLAFGGMLIVILYQINKGQQAVQVIPVVGVYAFAGYRLLPALHSLFGSLTVIKANAGKLHLVHRELHAGPSSPVTAEQFLRQKNAIQPAEFRDLLELRNVTFQYEGAKDPSLNGLSLKIARGALVGLVGPTGCGKTTTVDLILGLLTPDHGKILLDGTEIVDETQRIAWQKTVGYVPQTIYISDDTIARNIAFGVPDAEIDMAAVRKAATVANLAEFIETSLPEKYDSSIGERGVRLSGGQRQRIGIARALYRDPAVLVMDEATSALDGITEEAVMDAVHSLSKQKTIILIAHRLTTVRDCDVIYQLDRGAVATQGTYDELMQNSAWFRMAARGME